MAGLSITRVSPAAETVLVIVSLDLQTTAAGTGYLIGQLVVDGVAQAGQIIGGYRSAVYRSSVSNAYVVAALAASHTYKVQAEKTANDGTSVVNATHSTITVVPFPTG